MDVSPRCLPDLASTYKPRSARNVRENPKFGSRARRARTKSRIASWAWSGNPDRRQLAGAVQPGEVDRVAPVGFDPIAGLARDQRGRNDNVVVAGRRQLTLNAVAARSSLVAKSQRGRRYGSAWQPASFKATGVFAIVPYSRTSPRLPGSANATAIVFLCTSRPT